MESSPAIVEPAPTDEAAQTLLRRGAPTRSGAENLRLTERPRLQPGGERARMAAVRRYDVLDTPPDGAFDRITALAARYFEVPIAIVSVVDTDRVWFKSHHGLEVEEIGRDPGLCASAVLGDEPWIIEDARTDPRTLAHPLVAGEFGLRFYAGVPLTTRDGFNLGTLCVIDREPRRTTEQQTATLSDMAAIVMDELELRLAARKVLSGASERLVEADLRFAGAFAAAPTGMALVAADGRYMEVNPALCGLLGRTAEELLDMSFQQLTLSDELEADLEGLKRLAAGEIDVYQGEKRYLRPDGGIIWAQVTVTPARGADGQLMHLVVHVENITARRSAEADIDRYVAQLKSAEDRELVTGLADRRAFEVALEQALRVHAADGTPCSVVLAAITDMDLIVEAVDALAKVSREADPVAYLGDGEIALLLPGAGRAAAAAVARRAAAALTAIGYRSCTHATCRLAEDKQALLGRLREGTSKRDPPAVDQAVVVPPGVDRLLELARSQLGMAVSFLTHIDGADQVFTRFAGEPERFGVAEGDALPLAVTHCQRMIDGRIGSLVSDLAADPQTRELEVTRQLGLRAYAGVPVRFRGGELFGTLCCVDTDPRPELTERHVELLRFLGDLAGELIDDSAQQRAAGLALDSANGMRTLIATLQARDYYTSEHSKEVVALAISVARRLGLETAEIHEIEQVAMLHDIGKIGMPDTILQKQGPLDEREWQLMRQHPVVGERIIAASPGLAHLAPAIRAEHERWDGGGYPDGLAGEQIPLASRITLACDALQAMTSNRPYRPAMPIDEAREQLRSGAASQFDPSVIAALLTELEVRHPLLAHQTRPPRRPRETTARNRRGDPSPSIKAPGTQAET